MDDLQWGTVGEWFSGAGGFLAVLVAVWIARREHAGRVAERDRRLVVEQEDRDRQRRDEMAGHRRRAALVEATASGGTTSPAHREQGWLISNKSPDPVYEVLFTYRWFHGQSGEPISVGTLATDDTHKVTCREDFPDGQTQPSTMSWALTFTDLGGHRWRKNHEGLLELVADSGAHPGGAGG